MSARAQIDVESRSACPIKTHGGQVYSRHPSTEVLCLAFRLPSWVAGRTGLWHPGFPSLGVEEGEDFNDLDELFRWIDDGGLVEAHNAAFERAIWTHQLNPLGWPRIKHAQWRCSAAKAAAHALPRGLSEAGDALGLLTQKDDAGHKLMMRMTKPRKVRKAEVESWTAAGKPILYHESKEEMERLWAYCRQDVLTEEAVSAVLPDLSPEETAVFLMDMAINERGFQLDPVAVDTALRLIEAEVKELNRELVVLTGGAVQKATQRAQMMKWLATEGLFLTDTQGATIDALLEGSIDRSTPLDDDEDIPF